MGESATVFYERVKGGHREIRGDIKVCEGLKASMKEVWYG